MRDCGFLRGSHELFAVMGIQYGILMIEGYNKANTRSLVASVYCLEDGKTVLRKAVENGVLTTDRADTVEAAMIEAGLVTDERGFVQQVMDFVLPADHKPALSFKLHESDTINSPFPRGDIITDAGISVKRLINVWDGLEFCEKLVEAGKMRALDGAAILKAALKANVPLNADAIHRRWDALPDDTRRKYDQALAQLTGSDDIPGMGRLLVMVGLPLPDQYLKEIEMLPR